MGSETKEHLHGVWDHKFKSTNYWLKISTEHAATKPIFAYKLMVIMSSHSYLERSKDSVKTISLMCSSSGYHALSQLAVERPLEILSG